MTSNDPLFRNSDRRQDPRFAAKVKVTFKAAEDAAKALNTFSVNFSAGGLCVRSKKPHAVGDRIALSLDIDGEVFELIGTVAWARADVLGIRFEDVPAKDRSRLETVARGLAATHPPVPETP